jgi:hypothetical protein
LIVQRFRSFEDVCDTYLFSDAILGSFCGSDNGIFQFLDKVSSAEVACESIFSLHYTGKNILQVLLGIQYSFGENQFLQLCNELGGATLYKHYNKADIYQLSIDHQILYITLTNGFLLAATSSVVVESSIRHLASGRSLLDNQAFSSLLSLSTSESDVYVCVQQFDKIIGSLLGKRMLPYTDFVTKSVSWIALSGTTSGDIVSLSGSLLVDKGDANFLSVFTNQNRAPVKIWEQIPSSTMAFFSFSPSNFDLYRQQYDNYLEIHKKNKQTAAKIKEWEDKTGLDLNGWFGLLYPAEVGLAWVPVHGGYQWVTIVRSNQIQQVRKHLGFPAPDAKLPPVVLPNPAVGALSALFGPFFAKSPESYYTILDNSLFYGSKELLESLCSDRKAPSLYGVLKHGSAKGKWMEESGLTCVVQVAEARDSLFNLCNALHIPLIKKALSQFQSTLTIFQVSSLGGKPYANLVLYTHTTKPSSISAKTASTGLIDTESIPMNVGSFKIFNHISRKDEEIVQMADSILIQKDQTGKEMWRTRRKFAIVDNVAQIDYFRNNKLQMLFVSEGTELCLLDILGRLTSPYPVQLTVPARKGPFLFDLDSNKEYQIFLIHTDNSLRLYNRSGTASPVWRPFIPEDRIDQKPMSLLYSGEHYWIVFGTKKDYLLTSDGSVAVVFQRRNRIKQDAKIEIDTNGTLVGTTTQGRILTVQLSTGTIKTRKP